MIKAIAGPVALVMLIASPVCYTAGLVPLSVGLIVAGWAVLIGLAARMEGES